MIKVKKQALVGRKEISPHQEREHALSGLEKYFYKQTIPLSKPWIFPKDFIDDEIGEENRDKLLKLIKGWMLQEEIILPTDKLVVPEEYEKNWQIKRLSSGLQSFSVEGKFLLMNHINQSIDYCGSISFDTRDEQVIDVTYPMLTRFSIQIAPEDCQR